MRKIVMVGPDFDAMGGISAVVNVYRSAALLDRYQIKYLVTHRDGGMPVKLAVALAAALRFWTMLLLGQVGLLHVHMSSRASFWRKCLFFLPAFLFRVPTILHLHGSEFSIFYEEECGHVAKRAVRFVFNRVSQIVVLSQAWRDWVQSMTTNPNVQAIYNPVMVPAVHPRWEDRSDGMVLFLGRLGKRKGSYDLVDAMASIKQNCSNFHLSLGGDGELNEVRDRASDLGLGDQVSLLGWVRGTDKDRFLGSAKIYTLPSYNEGLPMSVLEAMACGLPIVGTPVGGMPEAITDGVEGFLVEAGDVAALSDRLERLLVDDALACKMGAAARAKVESTFSAEAVLPKVEEIYRRFGFSDRNSAASLR